MADRGMSFRPDAHSLTIVKLVELERARNVAGLMGLLDSDLAGRRGGLPIRGRAALALARIGSPTAAEHIAPLVSDPLKNVRFDAVIALGMIGDRGCCRALLPATRDESEVVRMAAAQSLGECGCVEARDVLLAMLGERNWGFGVHAAEALCHLPAGSDIVEGIEAAVARQRVWNRGRRRLARALCQARAAEARRTSGWGSV